MFILYEGNKQAMGGQHALYIQMSYTSSNNPNSQVKNMWCRRLKEIRKKEKQEHHSELLLDIIPLYNNPCSIIPTNKDTEGSF